MRQLRPQAGNHGVARVGALAGRFEVDKQKTATRPRATGKPHHRVHGRVFADDVHQRLQLALDGLKRNAAVSAEAAANLPGVLLRKKAFGGQRKQKHIEAHHGRQNQHDQQLAVQGPVQADGVAAVDAVKAVFKPPGQPRQAAWFFVKRLAVRLKQPGAHHRCGGQGNDQRNHHRRRQRDRKLAEQAPCLPTHEQQRDEHRHQRDADRQHGKADFLGPQQRGLEAVHTGLDVAAGVFQHHDGVVHHKAGGHGQGHQAQVVQTEAQQDHHAEGAQQ